MASLLPLFGQPLREARDAFEKLYFEHHLRLEGGNMTGWPSARALSALTSIAS
jgi:hypothetical protein